MVLDYDCFRDILKYVEKYCIYEDAQKSRKMHEVTYYEICNASELSEYDDSTKKYTIAKLFEGEYIKGYVVPQNKPETFSAAFINSVTMKGHDMLGNIKNDTIWNDVKSKLKTAGGASLTLLTQIVGQVSGSFAGAFAQTYLSQK